MPKSPPILICVKVGDNWNKGKTLFLDGFVCEMVCEIKKGLQSI